MTTRKKTQIEGTISWKKERTILNAIDDDESYVYPDDTLTDNNDRVAIE